MTPEERETMIKIGKAVTDQGKAIAEMLPVFKQIASFLAVEKPAPIPSTFDIPRTPRVSVVEHEGLMNRFKMELAFDQGHEWSPEKRQDHAIALLTEMEDLLRQYGVTSLTGNYVRSRSTISA